MDTITLVEGDGLLHPRGPLPPGIYWRRRLIVIGGTFVVMLLFITQCARGPGKDDSSAKTPAGSTSSSKSASSATKSPAKASTSKPATSTAPTKAAASPTTAATTSPEPSASPSVAAAPQPCKVPALQVSAKANGTTFAAGVSPVFTLTIKNSGPAPCTRDLSAAATELLVTSGPDRIWSSDDCAKPPAGKLTTLKANEIKTVSVTWNRRRSKPGTTGCVGAAALPGRYRVVGRLGDLRTGPDSFLLS